MKTKIITILFLANLLPYFSLQTIQAKEVNLYASQISNQQFSTLTLKSGKIVAIAEIISIIQKQYDGKVLDVRLLNLGEIYIYKLKFLTRKREIYNLYFDAKSKKLLDYNPNNSNKIYLP